MTASSSDPSALGRTMGLAVRRTPRFLRFLVSGGLTAAVDYGVIIGANAAGFRYRRAVTLGLAAALVANFALHKGFTFASRKPVRATQPGRYGMLVACNYLLMMAIIEVAHGLAGLPLLWAKTISLPVVAAAGYRLTARFVFREG